MLRNEHNEIRFIWLVVLLVVPFLLVAFLLRFIPIRILILVYTQQGHSASYANDLAQSLIMEDMVWSSLIGIIQGLMWYLIIFGLIRWVERSEFSLQAFGFQHNRKKIWLLPLGMVLGFALHLGYIFF